MIFRSKTIKKRLKIDFFSTVDEIGYIKKITSAMYIQTTMLLRYL